MSTNSTIGVRNDEGGVEYIYCHWDGNIGYNGRVLMQYFNSKEAAQELVDLGDVSALDVEGHDGDETEVGEIVEINGCNVNVYTGKRAGKKRYAHSPLDMVRNRGTAEYVYVFDDNWWVACRETDWEFEELTSWVSESRQPHGKMLKESADLEDLRDACISEGSLKPTDYIPKFLAVLKEYGPDTYDELVKREPLLLDPEQLEENDDIEAEWTIAELFDAMQTIAPEGCYFAGSEFDPACFGFWSEEQF